jgi:putative aldouronate transport system permease protein
VKGRQWPLYLMLLPSLVFLAVFMYAPMYGIILAFKSFRIAGGIFGSPWSDPIWENFWWVNDAEFWNVFGNTVKIAVAKFVTGFPAPIILALLINEVRRRKFKRTVQTILYLPHFISWVIFAGIVYRLLGGDNTSPYNLLRAFLGLDPADILAQESAFLPILVVTNLIKETGWGTIIYLAAIMGVNQELYDAASVDGCTRFQMTKYVTLPSIFPIIIVMLILAIPGVLSAGFDQVWNMSNAMVARASNILDIYVIKIGIQGGQYGYAISMGLAVQLLSFGLVLLANKLSKRGFGYGIF